jgi:hypothetical protein
VLATAPVVRLTGGQTLLCTYRSEGPFVFCNDSQTSGGQERLAAIRRGRAGRSSCGSWRELYLIVLRISLSSNEPVVRFYHCEMAE